MGALTGIVVLDLSWMFPGPYCTSLLRSMGAEVWKIERPGGGDPGRLMPGLFTNLNRGKRSVTLDLRREEGQAVFRAMAAKADVVVEGWQPGVATSLGVDYPAIQAVNPKIIYCSISGFGQAGPYCNKPGHDANFQGLSGALCPWLKDGAIDAPLPLPLADLSSGLFAALGTAFALIERQQTGRGKYLDISMADGLFTWVAMYDLMRFPPGSPFFQLGRDHISDALPHYGVFEASDGKLLTLGVVAEDNLWANLCTATGLMQFANLGLAARIGARDEIGTALRAALRQKDREEWLRVLKDADVPVTPVNTSEEARSDPQLTHRRLISQVTGPGGVSVPCARNPVLPPGAIEEIEGQGPPELGEHTGELLEKLGYGVEDIKKLRGSGVI